MQRILAHIGEPTEPPPIASARGPPAWDDAPEPAPDWDLLQQPESDFEPLSNWDQRIAWYPPALAGDGAAPVVSRRHTAPHRSCEPQHPTTRAPAPPPTPVSPTVRC